MWSTTQREYFTCDLSQVALVTFATYALANANNPDERLTADRAFVALSLFNILRFPLTMLPMVVTALIQVRGTLMWDMGHVHASYNIGVGTEALRGLLCGEWGTCFVIWVLGRLFKGMCSRYRCVVLIAGPLVSKLGV